MSKIAKLVQLFESGKVVQIPLPGGKHLTVWVQKLSSFHVEAAAHEGRIARARRMMAIRETGSDDYAVFASQVEASSAAALVAGLVSVKGNETLARVLRDIRSDPDWVERIEVIEHSGEQLEKLDRESLEVQQVAKMLSEYQTEIFKRVEQENADYKRDLQAMSEENLRELFREHYIDSQGLAAFSTTRQRYEVFYAARSCCAQPNADGKFDHKDCDHTEFLLDSANDLDDLPEEVFTAILVALMEVTVPTDLARFTDGPASSSESHGPSSTPEGSAASSPAETPGTPATIS